MKYIRSLAKSVTRNSPTFLDDATSLLVIIAFLMIFLFYHGYVAFRLIQYVFKTLW